MSHGRAEKLRKEGSQTQSITVFLHTPPFNSHESQYHPRITLRFNASISDTLALTAAELAFTSRGSVIRRRASCCWT